MISKLVAWAEDRPAAVARMRRALREYVIAGIRTTLPFFTWLVEQPDFLAGRFHTAWLDEVLEARQGEPFVTADARTEDVAAVAAALQAVLLAPSARGAETAVAAPPAPSRWTARARAEGLR
jgi:acetyl/propionyl-CoA carboxylase alpha subunit